MNASDAPVHRRGALRAGAGAALAGVLADGCTDRDAAGTPAGAVTDAVSPKNPADATIRPLSPRPAPGPHRFPGQPVQIDHGFRDRARLALTFHGQGAPAIARTVLAALPLLLTEIDRRQLRAVTTTELLT